MGHRDTPEDHERRRIDAAIANYNKYRPITHAEQLILNEMDRREKTVVSDRPHGWRKIKSMQDYDADMAAAAKAVADAASTPNTPPSASTTHPSPPESESSGASGDQPKL